MLEGTDKRGEITKAIQRCLLAENNRQKSSTHQIRPDQTGPDRTGPAGIMTTRRCQLKKARCPR